MDDENNSTADRLQQALQDSKKRKTTAAESAAKLAAELKRLAALHKKLEALPQNERRKVLDAAELRHVSAAPRPITPLKGLLSYQSPNEPSELLSVAATAPQTVPAPDGADTASGDIDPTKSGPVDRGWVMKKKALMEKHLVEWLTADRDFRDASENDLSKVAKAPGHGNWFEADALNWAKQRGKWKEVKQKGAGSLETVWTGKKHAIEG